MANPWEEISLSDYENHMKLDSVMQLQAMNQMMKGQFQSYPVQTVMILGIAGGNGLEHIDIEKYKKIYGVDINAEYLKMVQERYQNLSGILECLHKDLIVASDELPRAELVIANLLIEYIGYEVFQKTITHVQPRYVSCIIQINTDKKEWVSDSPYLHAFDDLDKVHHQMEENILSKKMQEIGYQLIQTLEHPLPNGKKLVQIDFKR
ncbi:MAG: methyltransferase type 11 [Eubacterium sp.]